MAYLLQHLLTDTARRAPRNVAVVEGERSLTYEELDRSSNQLARALQLRGVVNGDRVGILAPKSAAAVAAVFAVLKAGACYVPLDATSPDERLAGIVTDSGIAVVLADEATAGRAAAIATAAGAIRSVIVIDAERDFDRAQSRAPEPGAANLDIVAWQEVLAESADPLPEIGTIDTDLAYILYTSGSTGVPKGVMISHRASLNFVQWAVLCAELDEQDRVCCPAPLHFDLSVFDIYGSCKVGACLVTLPAKVAMFPVRLAEWIQQNEIAVWYSVPSVLAMLATHGNLDNFQLDGLRTVIFAGEVFPAKHLSRLIEQLPQVRLLNWYGPTETNVCTWYEVPRGTTELTAPVPIGKACTNVDVFAVDEQGRRVTGTGQEGELLVRGSGLMSGYWGQPEKTRQALVSSPLAGAYDEPAYRTGDVVTLDDHGNFVFLGRRDGMVKTRGYRVELGEVETALYGHPCVREAVVLPVPDELLGNRLRAVISTDGEGDLSREDLLEHCRGRLPAYMVPDTIEIRRDLPRTSTGKIDRVGLTSA